ISSVSLSLLFFNDPPPTDISTLSLHDALPISLVMMAPLGHAGLAGASSVGAYVNLVALLWAARRRLGPLGGRALVASAARTLARSEERRVGKERRTREKRKKLKQAT